MASAVINDCTTIGERCITNTREVVEHDNIIENHAHVLPNAVLGGPVRLGESSRIGRGASVIKNIDIYENCIVGAGDMVMRNIAEGGPYVGFLARKLVKNARSVSCALNTSTRGQQNESYDCNQQRYWSI